MNTFSSALVWFPTGDFEEGFSGQGWGDFEHHDKFSTRLAFHYSRSDENKESQPNSDQFENTQLRLSDGTVIFTPDIFGQGITITDARYRMTTVDGGSSIEGYSLEGEYYWRWLDNFVPGRQRLPKDVPARLRPRLPDARLGDGRTQDAYRLTSDIRESSATTATPGISASARTGSRLRTRSSGGTHEALYLHKSPVGYTSVPFAVGGKGFVFHSSFELAF